MWKEELPLKEPKVAGTSDEAVVRATGKGWQEWFSLLDQYRAADLQHKEIAELLFNKYALSPWWSQHVTVGYEQKCGRRQKHEKPTGFEFSVSKTLPISLSELFGYFRDSRARKKWLSEAKLNIRKIVPGKRILASWNGDGSSLRFEFHYKSMDKTQVVVQHGKLPDGEEVERMKDYWKTKLRILDEITSS